MKRWTGLVFGAAAVVVVGVWLAIGVEGQTPKAFALDSLDGRRVALADLAGRPALVYFWATW